MITSKSRTLLALVPETLATRNTSRSPTSVFCLTQEAAQRERAANAQLENVRLIAITAAVAWGREAALAQQREASYRHAPARPEIVAFSREIAHDLLNENPDRGRAT